MKPRQLAQTMIEEMRNAANKVWEDQGNLLEVEDKVEGKKWCWKLVCQHFARRA